MIPVAQIAQPYGVSIFQPQSTQVEMHAGIVNNFFTGVSPDPFTATAAADYAGTGCRMLLMTSDEGGSGQQEHHFGLEMYWLVAESP